MKSKIATKAQHVNSAKNSKQSLPSARTPAIKKSDPLDIIKRLRMNPDSLTREDIAVLQSTIGNKGVMKLLSGLKKNKALDNSKSTGKNNTNMPDNLKSGLETLSNVDLSDVRVHYNSDKPKEFGALAYAQGKDIHVASGQEKHLPHEGWHVVQQKLKRVEPMIQMKAQVNNDSALEKEADIMGNRASSIGNSNGVFQTNGLLKKEADVTARQFKKDAKKPKENLSGYMDIKGMKQFMPTKQAISTVDSNNEGKMDIRYGNIAKGSVSFTKLGDKYTMKPQALSFNHPLFSNAEKTVPGLQPCLTIFTDTSGMLTGYIGMWDGTSIPNKKDLTSLLSKDAGLLGLGGIKLDKNVQMINIIDNGVLKFGVNNVKAVIGNAFAGALTLMIGTDGGITFSGSAEVSVKGLAKGTILLNRLPKGIITGSGSIGLNLKPQFQGSLTVNVNENSITGVGRASYKGGKLSGDVTLRLSDKNDKKKQGKEQGTANKTTKPDYVVTGEGDLAFEFTKWLSGNAHVEVDEKGYVTIIGNIIPQKEVELFPQKNFNKKLIKLEVRAAYGIPVVGNVFVFANIGLEAFAKLGPAKLYKISVGGTYSTNPETCKNFTIQGSLNISAAAGIILRAEGGAGVQLLGHDIKAGIGLEAKAGIMAYAEATPVIGYREKAKPGEDKKGEFFISGDLDIAAQPFFGFGGDLFVEIDSPWWSPLGDKLWKWPLFDLSYPLGSTFGINAHVDHVFGSNQIPEIKFSPVQFSGEKFLTDLMNNDKKSKKTKGTDKKQGKWTEKNSGKKDPPAKKKVDAGDSLTTTKPKPRPGTTGKRSDNVNPNARTAEGKTVKQLQDEKLKKSKKNVTKDNKTKGKTKKKENKQKKDRDTELRQGIAALQAVVDRYKKNGATREEVETGVKAVRRKFKVFKSIKVVDGKDSWDIVYEYNPTEKLNGPKKKTAENIKIPSVREGKFSKWFNSISLKEFNKIWENAELRDTIEDRLRSPGGLHEWHMVSRAPTFKKWGVTAEDIAEMRTPTKDVKFKNPKGEHGGEGSTTAHNEILDIIDSSPDYRSFVKGLREWANKRLEGGSHALPGKLKS